MKILQSLLSALDGVWGLLHQRFTGVAQMSKIRMSTTGESGDDTDRMTILDSGASGHHFDDELHPSLKDKLLTYKESDKPRMIITARRHVLLGTATSTASGVVVDENGTTHRVDRSGLVVTGLGHHLFSASQAAKTGLHHHRLSPAVGTRTRCSSTANAGQESRSSLL